MGRYKEHKDALNTIIEKSKQENILFIHYSCENFLNIKNGATPRITSIAINEYNNGQVKSFSMYKTAEIKKIKYKDVDKHYDEIEKDMLKEFFDYVKEHKTNTWIHFNMRSINFGFQTLEHRYRILGGKPEIIDDKQKFDLAQQLELVFGSDYIKHPRLENITKLNDITDKEFLSGKDEAKAFENKEYWKLHQSTLRKVQILETIFRKIINGRFKTKAKFKEKYGITLQSILDFTLTTWWGRLLAFLLSTVIGGLITKVIWG